MFAHYTATKTTKFITLSATARPDASASRITVDGKAHARKVAAAHNAKPHNF